jgi:LDH2 family malate/lactate/ureidoglycolate dehydrogenase
MRALPAGDFTWEAELLVTVTIDELTTTVQGLVEAVGTPPDNAKVVTRLIVGSHLAGHDSHGVQHLPRYLEEAQNGLIMPAAQPEVISDSPSAALVRGNWGWGHVTADYVMRLAVEKASTSGIAMVSAVECNHIGRLGDYVEEAAAKGCIGILTSGGNAEELATAAPFGGTKAVLAPNPIAFAFPADADHPVLVDFATTIVAGGKLALAKAKGKQVQLGWIIDKHGKPTTDPNDYYDGGALLPFGEHKGFGVMVAAEILGRIFSGADDHSNTEHGGTYFKHCGITFVAIRANLFDSSFAARTSELSSRVRAVPPQPEVEAVMMPGDYEYKARVERVRNGRIDIPESTWEEVVSAARHLGKDVTASSR